MFFTHCHTIGASSYTGDNEIIDKQGADKLLAALKRQYPQVFGEPTFLIQQPVEQHFEHHIQLNNPSIPPPRYKIYPLDQTEQAELKKQIIELLKENKIRVSDSPYGAPSFLQKKRMDNYVQH